MPFYEKGDVRIHYEEAGSGFPLLLIPGGGLNGSLAFQLFLFFLVFHPIRKAGCGRQGNHRARYDYGYP